jgi:NAD(P)H dehydrogenase (quinone)
MARLLIAYYSRTGHTEQMAESVAEGARQVEAVEVDLKPVGKIEAKDLLDYDAIVFGSPTYYGTMAAEVKKLIDESVSLHGKLAGKVGGAFASSANVAGGNETTVLDLLKALLVHGMIIRGDAVGDHYGPVAIGAPDQRAKEGCQKLGRMVAELTMKLHA